MEVKLKYIKGTWNEVLNRCRTTVNKGALDKEELIKNIKYDIKCIKEDMKYLSSKKEYLNGQLTYAKELLETLEMYKEE